MVFPPPSTTTTTTTALSADTALLLKTCQVKAIDCESVCLQGKVMTDFAAETVAPELAVQQPEVAAKASSAASSPPGDLSVEEMKAAADALTAQRLSTASAHAALIKAATAAAADRKQLEEEAQLQNSKARASAGELR